MVCTDIRLHDLILLADQLRRDLESAEWPDVHGLDRVTASFGVAVSPGHGSAVQELFMSADSALYRAKANGRNRVECTALVEPEAARSDIRLARTRGAAA